MKNLLFLYTEISGYFLACARRLSEKSGAQVHIVRWKVNAEAPFEFAGTSGVVLHERDQFDALSLEKFCLSLNPAVVYVAGKMDKTYLKIAGKIKANGTPVLFGFDNHWTGSVRQIAASFLSRWLIHTRFTHCWIPGEPQMKFAQKLGFRGKQILTGVYAGDIGPFQRTASAAKENKLKNYPRNLLFCGRLVESKGVQDLVNAFSSLTEKQRNGWTLTLVGTGPMENQFPAHPAIKMAGFVQPVQLPEFVAGAGAFILPSRFEPWGVALHEFAAGELPLIASKAVGAASAFVRESQNGFLFNPANTAELARILEKLFNLPESELIKMGKLSGQLARTLTPDTWSDTLLQLIR